MTTLEVNADYGYVVFVFVASIVLLQWLGFKVAVARKKYGIKYPQMYGTKLADNVFNCVQRAHQNTLEGYSVFIGLLFLGGLVFPRVSAVAGLIYLFGRVVYAVNYSSGDPEKRNRGAFGYIGLITLLVNTVILGLRMLGILSA